MFCLDGGKLMFRKVFALGILLMSVFLLASLPLGAQMETVHHTTGVVRTHPSLGEMTDIEGAHAELFSTEDGIAMNIRTTGLENGHVYTAWWIVFNNPENCAAEICTPADIGAEGVNGNVTYADGILLTEDGRMELAGSLATGEIPEAWFDVPLSNPLGADVHIVLHDHGPVIPEMAGDMINSLRAGCTDESVPPPYPDHAKADGEPGPNTCQLIQVVVFEQGE
jgi:hypothetical protein